MSLLTVVTVVKDDESGLCATLNSLERQDSNDFTLVILDGSSDVDRVPDFVRDLRQFPVVYHWSAPAGVYAAMNDALPFVKTPYVYFLNAGDQLASVDVLSRVTAMLELEEPLWGFGRVLFYSESGRALTEPTWSYTDERRRLFARGLFPAHQGVVVRTSELVAQGGFDTRMRVAADYSSMLQFAAKESPLEFGFPVAVFRQGGLSTTEWRLSLREFHQARIKVFRPAGVVALLEQCDTLLVRLRTHAFHLLKRFGFGSNGHSGNNDFDTRQ